MAKYTINFSCGHIEQIQLVGKIDDRYKKIAYLEEEGLCNECYKKQKKKQIEKESEGLPVLEGSEKQIDLAMRIRLEKIKSLQLNIDLLIPIKFQVKLKEEIYKEGIAKYIDKIKSTLPAEKQENIIELFFKYNNLIEELNEVKTTTSAKWLIENQ